MPTHQGGRGRSRKPPRSSINKRPSTQPVRRKKVPPPLKIIQRPGRWWREPLPTSKLQGLSDDEAAFHIAQERQYKTERIKEQIREMRHFSTEFEAARGYPLRDIDIIRLSASKLRKLKRAHETLKHATSQPYVEFRPRSSRQKKAAKQRAGEIFPGQRRYIIHHGDAATAKAEYKDDEIQITTKVRGGAIYERIYFFERHPRSWKEVVNQTKKLMKRGMRTGYYKIYNTIYGPIGELVSIDALIDSLEQFFSTYNKWLAGTILGWTWMGTSVDTSRKRQRQRKTTAERFQERRKELLQREQDRVKRRLGMKVPKRRKRKKRR